MLIRNTTPRLTIAVIPDSRSESSLDHSLTNEQIRTSIRLANKYQKSLRQDAEQFGCVQD